MEQRTENKFKLAQSRAPAEWKFFAPSEENHKRKREI
jgi:hypothetical protein